MRSRAARSTRRWRRGSARRSGRGGGWPKNGISASCSRVVGRSSPRRCSRWFGQDRHRRAPVARGSLAPPGLQGVDPRRAAARSAAFPSTAGAAERSDWFRMPASTASSRMLPKRRTRCSGKPLVRRSPSKSRGAARRDFQQLVVSEHLERRLVGALGQPVAEQVELAQDAEALPRERVGAADGTESLGIERRLAARSRRCRRSNSIDASSTRSCASSSAVRRSQHAREVNDVVDEVAQVPRLERPRRPSRGA